MCAKCLVSVAIFSIFFHNCCEAQVADRYDVVIDEIMADPIPQVALGPSEYIELKNVSTKAFDLFKWKISDESSAATISTHYILMPDSFVVICPNAAVSSFLIFGPAIGVSNFPSLNNDEDIISLISPEGKLIHAVNYNNQWFNNAVKSDGGWSLEMIDTHMPCLEKTNWSGSIDPRGGTPSMINSINGIVSDIKSPSLIRCFMKDSATVCAIFDESLDSSAAVYPAEYLLDHGMGNPATVVAASPLFKQIDLHFAKPFERSMTYLLSISAVKDCSNNAIGQLNVARVGLPGESDTMDMVINEILFNPLPDGFDYVEFYNRSEKIIDASQLYIANRTTAGAISSPRKITSSPFLIFPGDYLVISENIEKVQLQYLTRNPTYLIEMNSLPSFPNDKGAVVLMNQFGNVIDEVDYDEQWHFPLISNRKGVALERIDAYASSQLRSNWTSAASTVGYGTPTYQNSESRLSMATMGSINIRPPTFSPDNDGSNDICFIYYEMNAPNYVGNIRVYDINGLEVRNLFNNITLSQKGYLTWNGLGENNKQLPAGLYIIHTSVFNLQGKTNEFRNAVVLAKRF